MLENVRAVAFRIAPTVSLVFAVVISILTGLRATYVPSEEAWKGAEALPWLYVACLGILAVAEVTAGLARSSKRRERRLEDACRQVAARIEEIEPKIPLSSSAVHIWRVSEGDSTPLKRIAAFMLIGERPSSGVKWEPGKGVLGKCLEERKAVVVNLDKVRKAADGPAEDWEALPLDVTLGMTQAEAKSTDSYFAIWARPLYDRRQTKAQPKIKGILAIDVTESGHFNHLKKATQGNKLSNVIGVCESTI